MRPVHTRLVLALTLSLLPPAAASAQTPAASQAVAAPQVQIEVSFVTVRSADLSADLAKSGMNFDRVPLVPPAGTFSQSEMFLRYMPGDAAVRLLQMLTHGRSKFVQAPPVTTADGIPVTIQISTQVPGPQKTFLTLQTGLTIAPRINTDDSITLNVGLQTADATVPLAEPQKTTLRTIRSGDMMVVDGLPLGNDRPDPTEKLLVFIQPSFVGTSARRGDAGQPVPPSLPLQNASPMLGTTVSMDVFNADLHAVIALLERQSHLKASVLGVWSAYKPVDVHLSGASLPEALGAIARSAGAQIVRDEHGVYVFSPLPGAVTTTMPKAPVGSM